MNIKPKFLLPLIFLPSISFAFFCPTNFSQIDFGASLDQITQTCGKPDKQETKDLAPKVPQEWSYFIPQTVAANTTTSAQGTLRTTITFDSAGNAVNISVNGLGVGSTSICGKPVTLGDTRDSVKAACGEPSFINSQQNPAAVGGISGNPQQPPDQMTTFTYSNTNPPVKLIFINGKLTKRE